MLLILVVSLSGFGGITMPSRDMIVRSVAAGSFGKVFGFVTTGFHIGMVAPVIFGQLADHGHPRAVFLLIAAGAGGDRHGRVRDDRPAHRLTCGALAPRQ